jgi:hypothetical protein
MRYRTMRFGIVMWGAMTATFAACAPSGPPSPYAVLGADAGLLRAAFNRDSGKVRVVMLVAPT